MQWDLRPSVSMPQPRQLSQTRQLDAILSVNNTKASIYSFKNLIVFIIVIISHGLIFRSIPYS